MCGFYVYSVSLIYAKITTYNNSFTVYLHLIALVLIRIITIYCTRLYYIFCKTIFTLTSNSSTSTSNKNTNFIVKYTGSSCKKIVMLKKLKACFNSNMNEQSVTSYFSILLFSIVCNASWLSKRPISFFFFFSSSSLLLLLLSVFNSVLLPIA